MPNLQLTHYEILNDLLLLQWNDNSENALQIKGMRDNCPCAHCSGETDVFGNIYKGAQTPYNKDSFVINGIQPVGYYALRPYWKDGHHSGIYSFEFLRSLSENQTK